jgi:hypothetical protein
LVTPGFLENGIDFDMLIDYYIANNYRVEVINQPEVKVAAALTESVINNSHGYQDGDSPVKQLNVRLQMIFNSMLWEKIVKICSSLIRKSSAVWLVGGSYEKGTDFQSTEGVDIEAKVYKDINSMNFYAKKGSVDYTVFHGAEYVLCYLINSYKNKHVYWLKKTNGIYHIYNNEGLEDLTHKRLPATIPICYCKMNNDKVVFAKNTFYT